MPGANLAASLRRSPPAAGGPDGHTLWGPGPASPPYDGAQSGAMLSRFQSGQQAGRAAAGPIPPGPDEEGR